MNFDDYQKEAFSMSARDLGEPLTLAVWGLGLAGEASEVVDSSHVTSFDEMKKELGDVLWYVSAICTQRGILLSRVIELSSHCDGRFPSRIDFCVAVGKVVEMIKKHVGHGHALDDVVLTDRLAKIVAFIIAIAADSFTLADIADANIAKLRERYGDRFSSEASINRSS
ncbi:MAG: MazG nucleotide pyrophosphohydrolase domain-containing protein [Cyanobacteria bacterium J06607_13]